ncbi:MAG: ATP synthase subunit I [Gammaproteobacteria bacterium]
MQQDQLDLTQQHQQSKRQAISYIKAQLVLTVVISALLLIFDVVKAYSALTGGLIATIASAWFAYKVFRVSPGSAAETMLASAYMGEIYKIVLTGALFLCAFVLIRPVSAVVLLITYFVIHMTPALVSAIDSKAGSKADDNAGNGAGDTETKREKDG